MAKGASYLIRVNSALSAELGNADASVRTQRRLIIED